MSFFYYNNLFSVSVLKKETLLKLEMNHLCWLVTTMREWILFQDKNQLRGCDPKKLVKGIDLVLQLETSKIFDSLPDRVLHRVMNFVFSGVPEEWLSIKSSIKTLDLF